MTFDQKIQVWNVIATWLASIATFLAVAVPLYLTRQSKSIQRNARVQDTRACHLRKLRGIIHTSGGKTIEVVPDDSVLKLVKDYANAVALSLTHDGRIQIKR